LDWDRRNGGLVLVGDAGRILKLADGGVLAMNSGTRQNLRAISIAQNDGGILIVGNSGTAILVDENGRQVRLELSTTENLRTVVWKPNGNEALIAGNGGTLLKYSKTNLEAVGNARANLRRVSWHPQGSNALVTSNCFAEEFVPSPNLFVFNSRERNLSPANEGRVDLIGVDWKPDGRSALVVGYDVIWHNGFIGIFDGGNLSPIGFENKRIYPVTVSWSCSNDMAAIATATTQPGFGQGILYLWNAGNLRPIFASDRYFFSAVAWDHEGIELAALASSATRAFNC